MRSMKVVAAVFGLSLGVGLMNVSAHDEGHGPKLDEMAEQGGVIAPVIDVKDSEKGAKAVVVYKAELVRSEDGEVSVYVYGKDMRPLDLGKLDKSAKGVVETEKKGKVTKVPFSLNLADGFFTGKPPRPASKPFNIEVRFKEGERQLLTVFNNLD